MNADSKAVATERKYRLPYHWVRDPLAGDSLPYHGYIEIVLEHLPGGAERVLDAGCGDGWLSHLLAERSREVVGVERLEHLVGYSRTLVPQGRFYRADLREPGLAERLPDGPASFDAAVLMEVYEHIPPQDCPAVLKNLATLLRPGGTLIVSVPSRELPASELHYRHFEPDLLRRELDAGGFDVQQVVGQDRLGGWRGALRSRTLERWLFNNWLQPRILLRVRRYLYRRHVNRVREGSACGRYIAIARRRPAETEARGESCGSR
jgi:2-polyprenyl-3-methyl-5-hydroxy-6-metoxy-1,4-benzoquinol methylase